MRRREVSILAVVSLLGLAMTGCIGLDGGEGDVGTASDGDDREAGPADPGTVSVEERHDYTGEEDRVSFTVPANTRLGELRMAFEHWTPGDQDLAGVCSTSGEVRIAIVAPDGEVFDELTTEQSGGLALGSPSGTCGSEKHQTQSPGEAIPAGEWALVFEGQGYIVGSVTFAS